MRKLKPVSFLNHPDASLIGILNPEADKNTTGAPTYFKLITSFGVQPAVARQWLGMADTVKKINTHHEPAGSPKGGEFANTISVSLAGLKEVTKIKADMLALKIPSYSATNGPRANSARDLLAGLHTFSNSSTDTLVARGQDGVFLGALQGLNTGDAIDKEYWIGLLAVNPDILLGKIKAHGVGTRLMVEAAKLANGHPIALGSLGPESDKFYTAIGMKKVRGDFRWNKTQVKAIAKQGRVHKEEEEFDAQKAIQAALKAEKEGNYPLTGDLHIHKSNKTVANLHTVATLKNAEGARPGSFLQMVKKSFIDILNKVTKGNSNHMPAGTAQGGQFARATAGPLTAALQGRPKQYDKATELLKGKDLVGGSVKNLHVEKYSNGALHVRYEHEFGNSSNAKGAISPVKRLYDGQGVKPVIWQDGNKVHVDAILHEKGKPIPPPHPPAADLQPTPEPGGKLSPHSSLDHVFAPTKQPTPVPASSGKPHTQDPLARELGTSHEGIQTLVDAKNRVEAMGNNSLKDIQQHPMADGGVQVKYYHDFHDHSLAEIHLPAIAKIYNPSGQEPGNEVYVDLGKRGKVGQVRIIAELHPKVSAKELTGKPMSPAEIEKIESHLKNDPIKRMETLGQGGVAGGKKHLFFEDGSEGVFKPHAGEAPDMRGEISNGRQTERETGAWEVAKAIGMSDMVSPAVEREINGHRGVVLHWQEGDQANDVYGDKKYDGNRDAARAAAFDYVIGNEDRHAGNWLVDSTEGRIHLIDHGLSFPDKGDMGDHNAAMIRHGISTGYAPSDFGDLYANNQAGILSAMGKAGLPPQAMEGVRARIKDLRNHSLWSDLGYGNGRAINTPASDVSIGSRVQDSGYSSGNSDSPSSPSSWGGPPTPTHSSTWRPSDFSTTFRQQHSSHFPDEPSPPPTPTHTPGGGRYGVHGTPHTPTSPDTPPRIPTATEQYSMALTNVPGVTGGWRAQDGVNTRMRQLGMMEVQKPSSGWEWKRKPPTAPHKPSGLEWPSANYGAPFKAAHPSKFPNHVV